MTDYFKNQMLKPFQDGDKVVVGFDESAFFERGNVPLTQLGIIKTIDQKKFILIGDQLIHPDYIFTLEKVD